MRTYGDEWQDDDPYGLVGDPYDGDCKFTAGSDAGAVVGVVIGMVLMLAIGATGLMAFLKVAAWAWA